MALAIRTGISPGAWADEGERAIVTAWELLERADQAGDDDQAGDTGRQLSG